MAKKSKEKEKAKKKFTYKRRSAEDFDRTAKDRGGRFATIWLEEFNFITSLSEGEYKIRILPPTWEDPQGFGFPLFVHGSIGPDNEMFLCNKRMGHSEDCAVDDAVAELKREGDKDAAQRIDARSRRGIWFLPRDGKKTGAPTLWAMPQGLEAEIAGKCKDKDTGEYRHIDDPDEGFDVWITVTGKGKKTRYTAEIANKSSPLHKDPDKQDEILEYVAEHPVPDCLRFYENKHIEGLLVGGSGSDDDDDDEEERPRTRKQAASTGRRRNRGSDDESDDDDDDDKAPKSRSRSRRRDDEDDDDEAAPRSRRKGRKSDDDDDDDEEDRPKAKKGKAKKVVEDDDEEDEDEDGEDPLDDDDDDEEDEKPVKKKSSKKEKTKPTKTSKSSKKRPADDDDDDDDDDDEDDDQDEDEDDEPPKKAKGREPAPKKKDKSSKGKKKPPADEDDDDDDIPF